MDHGQVLSDIKDSTRYTMGVPSNGYLRAVQQAINDCRSGGSRTSRSRTPGTPSATRGLTQPGVTRAVARSSSCSSTRPIALRPRWTATSCMRRADCPAPPEEVSAIEAEQAELFGKVPVPHDAAAIWIDAHGPDHAAVLGKDLDSTAHDLSSVVGNVGGLRDDRRQALVAGATTRWTPQATRKVCTPTALTAVGEGPVGSSSPRRIRPACTTRSESRLTTLMSPKWPATPVSTRLSSGK